ncbi:MAG: helix-turn-helix domain-containing protein [Nostoc desertorum CM1-VF14]|nr:helix-turn-helix domain-containing protein [Nostoc desertorum CM1-VF14]
MNDRAEVIRLSTNGWHVQKIAAHFNWTAQTMREVLHRWEKLGVEGLWEKAGRGGISPDVKRASSRSSVALTDGFNQAHRTIMFDKPRNKL